MHSLLLLLVVACLLAVPGIAGSLAAFGPGQIAPVTRVAAAFGLGFAVAGGCAFLLAAAGAFSLGAYLPTWAVVSAGLWVLAIRRSPLGEQARSLGKQVRDSPLPMLLGACVIVAIAIAHLHFMHVLGAPREVYYLNGLQIANSGGVPSSTLEYGQAWPPATDKIFLDSFTGIVAILGNGTAAGPGVLLWISTVGAAIGLWAMALELGLGVTGGLVPLLALSNQTILGSAVTLDFMDYRAEDFGRAVAFCAVALGIHAFRQKQFVPAIVAGVILGVASGAHLVPVLVAVLTLGVVALTELLRRDRGTDDQATAAVQHERRGPRFNLAVLRQAGLTGAVSAVLFAVIRIFAGGTFGLGGASSPSGYNAIHTRFDPTAYLFTGKFISRTRRGGSHWYQSPVHVVSAMMRANGIAWPSWGLWLLLAGALAAALVVGIVAPGNLRTAGVVGFGMLASVIVVALVFDYHFHVWIDATFGTRRLRDFISLGLILIALALVETALSRMKRSRPPVAAALSVALVVSLSAWLLPAGVASGDLDRTSTARTELVNWVRTETPCGARFLVNQRTEGTFSVLTGRFALLEGMGSFLRTDTLAYVVSLMLDARHFFESPLHNEAYLRSHDISYVVVARGNLVLGYEGPAGAANIEQLNASPFLRRISSNRYFVVYQVRGARPAPVSRLLKGPYLHCLVDPVQF